MKHFHLTRYGTPNTYDCIIIEYNKSITPPCGRGWFPYEIGAVHLEIPQKKTVWKMRASGECTTKIDGKNVPFDTIIAFQYAARQCDSHTRTRTFHFSKWFGMQFSVSFQYIFISQPFSRHVLLVLPWIIMLMRWEQSLFIIMNIKLRAAQTSPNKHHRFI